MPEQALEQLRLADLQLVQAPAQQARRRAEEQQQPQPAESLLPTLRQRRAGLRQQQVRPQVPGQPAQLEPLLLAALLQALPAQALRAQQRTDYLAQRQEPRVQAQQLVSAAARLFLMEHQTQQFWQQAARLVPAQEASLRELHIRVVCQNLRAQ